MEKCNKTSAICNKMKGHDCTAMCYRITDEMKEEIQKKFSLLNKPSKISFINSIIKRTVWKTSGKERVHRSYFLESVMGKIKICKITLLNILRLTKREFNDLLFKDFETKEKKAKFREKKRINQTSPELLKPTKIEEKTLNTEIHYNKSGRIRKITKDATPEIPTSTIRERKRTISQGTQTELQQITTKICFVAEPNSMESFTIRNIKRNPKLFLGVSNVSWIDEVCVYLMCSVQSFCLLLQKIRLNNSLDELTFYYNRSRSEVSKVLYDLPPLLSNILSQELEWDSNESNSKVIPKQLGYKFGSVGTILKLERVRLLPSQLVYKFFISFTPLGRISFVSDVIPESENNEVLINRGNFLQTIPKTDAVIIDIELTDIVELLTRSGHTVFLRRDLDDHSLYSSASFLQRDLRLICQKADLAHKYFKEFRIFEGFTPSEFEDRQTLKSLAVIAAALINIQFMNDKLLE